jgi:hypothetical protein
LSSGLAVQTAPGTVEFAPPSSAPMLARSAAGTGLPAVPQLNVTTVGRQATADAPAATRAEVTGVEATNAPAATAPTDTAALADELYELIEYRLRTTLLLERERLGSLPDY